jgi:type VI secretion system protein ImpA
MPAPVIDTEALLKPISRDKPCGSDVRESKTFEMLKEARREEELLNQGEWKRDLKVADWPKVIQTATKILESEGKDLQAACWLVEGLVKRNGFIGLRDGLRVLRRLHEQFWDSFYPLIEDGDVEFRSGRLEALNKVLPMAIKGIGLIHPPGGPVYGYWHYKEAQDVENLRRGAASDAEKRRQLSEALEEGKLESDKFEKAAAATPLTHCSALLDQISQAWEEFGLFDKVLEEKYGENAPSLRQIKDAIAECRALMDSIVKKKGGIGLSSETATMSNSDQTDEEAVVSGNGQGFGPTVDPRSRLEALRQLSRVAEFFRKTEPHSPVSYLVQRAARWGEMPLDEWLQEVIKNDGVLGEVRETLGLNPPKSEPENVTEQ